MRFTFSSIRTKLCLALTVLISCFYLATWLLTTFGFEYYYTERKKDALADTATEVEELYKKSDATSLTELDQISNHIGAGIVIVNQDRTILYTSRPSRESFSERPMGKSGKMGAIPDHHSTNNDLSGAAQSPDLLPLTDLLSKQKWSAIDSKTFFLFSGDQKQDKSFLNLIRQTDDNKLIIIRHPLAPITESVAIAVTFIQITGALCALLGLLAAFLYASRFTQPLFNLNRLALRMAQLDFSEKWDSTRTDEIGKLGYRLNYLSEQLDTAISKLHDSNEKLAVELSKKEEAEKMRKKFLSAVSHELKTPLAIIQGYAEALNENIAVDELTRQRYGNIIISESEKMDALVKDLLNLSRLESQGFSLERVDFDLNALLNGTLRRFAQALQEKNLILQSDYAETLPINGDPLHLEQVISNIFSNAIDHTNAEHHIRLAVTDEGPNYRLTIYNEGNPIPLDEQKKIWTEFYKIDSARTRKFGGHGLGLSIVKTLQELHHQEYGVYNTSRGVAFWVTFSKQ